MSAMRRSALMPASEEQSFALNVAGAADSSGVIYYTVRRTGKSRIAVRVSERGVVVTAPRWVPNREIEAFVEEKCSWIIEHYDRWQKARADSGDPARIFAEGGRLPFRGGTLTLRLGAEKTAMRGGSELEVAVSAGAGGESIAREVFLFLFEAARSVIGERIEKLAPRFPRQATKLALSNAKRQWGSCTSAGHIYFCWRLIFFSDDVIDYVIAHEFSHRVHMDHSPAFWRQVESILPTYRTGRDKLRAVHIAALPL